MARAFRLGLSTLEDRLTPALLDGVTVGGPLPLVQHLPIPSNAVPVITEGADGVTVHFVDPLRGIDYATFSASDRGFTKDVTAVLGDLDNDGFSDIVLAATRGGSRLVVVNGKYGTVSNDINVFGGGFRGGLSVAMGDVNRDGKADIIVGAGGAGGPRVKVLDGATAGRDTLADYFAFDANFRGGVTVASGDVDGDGKADVIVAAGPGGGPHVRIFSGAASKELKGFFAYDSGFRGGVSLAAADTDGDGKAEIITGAGPGGAARVRVFGPNSVKQDFFADDPAFRTGVFVGATVVDGTSSVIARVRHGDQEIVRQYDEPGYAGRGFRRRVTDNPNAYPGESDGPYSTKYSHTTPAVAVGTLGALNADSFEMRVGPELVLLVKVSADVAITLDGARAVLGDFRNLSTVVQVVIRYGVDGRLANVEFTRTTDPLPTGQESIAYGTARLITSSRVHVVDAEGRATAHPFAAVVTITRNGATVPLEEIRGAADSPAAVTLNAHGEVVSLRLTRAPLTQRGYVRGVVQAVTTESVTVITAEGETVRARLRSDVQVRRNGETVLLADIVAVAVGEHAGIYLTTAGEVQTLAVTTPGTPRNAGVRPGTYTGTVESVTATGIRLRVSPAQVLDLAVAADLDVRADLDFRKFSELGTLPAGSRAQVRVDLGGIVANLFVHTPVDPARAVDAAPGSFVSGSVLAIDPANGYVYIGRPPVYSLALTALPPAGDGVLFRVKVSDFTRFLSPYYGWIAGGGTRGDDRLVPSYSAQFLSITFPEFAEAKEFEFVNARIGADGFAREFGQTTVIE